jgi:hypothetical protein
MLQVLVTMSTAHMPSFDEFNGWTWRENPHGACVDWNTAVACEGR